MKYYLDITLLPSDDIGIHFLWSKVMMQVHLALVEIKDEHEKVPVAVGFPQYREKKAEKQSFLGHQLRLFAKEKTDLERLDINKWLNRLADYVHIKGVGEVPETSEYESFNRRTLSVSPEKLIRRRMKRHDETLEQASAHFDGYKMSIEDKALPFIKMKSLTSQDEFHLGIIRKRVASKEEGDFVFNTYGLSAQGVLPKF